MAPSTAKEIPQEKLLAAFTAAFHVKDDSFGNLCFLMAALLDVPKTTTENWVHKAWKPTAMQLIEDAKTAGRLDSSGGVVKEKLSPSKPKAGKSSVGTKRGRAIKSTPKKGSKRVKHESEDADLEAEFDSMGAED